MPIKQGDIQLLASRVMDDVPEGGAGPSAVVIEDGKSNAIVPDISESDRARGRVNMRQVHLAVRTQDTDTYMGANVIVAEPPSDPNVSITLFSTEGVYDTRSQAQARLEAYLNKGAEWSGFLYEDHIRGQRVIVLFQRPGSELPAPGKTLALVQNEGQSNEILQYVRAIRVSGVLRTFTYDTDKDYQALVVEVELSDPLRSDFTGSSANRQFVRSTNAAKLRDTLVADAASYVGCTPLKLPAALGSFTAVAQSIYTQLVPSSQTETPMAAALPYASAIFPVQGTELVSFNTAQNWSTTSNLNLPGGCTPGTLRIGLGSNQMVDAGGQLMLGSQVVGTVDYVNGIVVSTSGSYAGTKTITYRPAAFMQRMPQSSEIPVTAETRSMSYVRDIVPTPARGTLSVSYQVQKRWYTLTDSGDGKLRGAAEGLGAGTINPDTGSCVVTLGALPDVGSSIILQWGVPTQETVQPGADLRMSQAISIEVPETGPVWASSFFVRWVDGEQPREAQSQVDGSLTGDATGKVNVARRELVFSPNILPPAGTQLEVSYDYGEAQEVSLSHPSRSGDGRLKVHTGVGALIPGTVVVQWNTLTDVAVVGTYTRDQIREMGISTMVDPIQHASDNGAGKLLLDGQEIGDVDYGLGEITFRPDVTVQLPKLRYSAFVQGGQVIGNSNAAAWRLNYAGIDYVAAPSVYPNDETGWVKMQFRAAGSATRIVKTVPFVVDFDLVPGLLAPMVPGSVVLKDSQGHPITDSGVGVLRELGNDGWLQRGTVNYVTGRVQLTSWNAGVSSTLRRVSTITTLGENISSAYVFRTAAAPLRPGSLSIQFATASGVQTVTASIAGVISAPGVIGTVDVETGLVRLGFGRMVVAVGNEAQPWFDATHVQADGRIFKPEPVVASALRYSGVAYSYLPLDAQLLGVDPVRLPSDGRVPMFRAGRMCVVGHQAVTGQAVVSNGQTIDLGRVRLSRVAVRDANDKRHVSGFTADLEAGRITFTDISAYAQPVAVEHRIEDYVMAVDVQITGEIRFNRPLTHDYPAGSYVSGALEAGDRHARVSLVFPQNSWDNATWADAPSGAQPPAKYDQSVSPIEITNAGASTERWVLQFTSNTQFRVIGEHVGVIATGDINTVCAPLNPATGQPYFSIKPLGWGSGWVNGNIVRINTVGGSFPFWVVRTVQAGPETTTEHRFALLARGDVDRP